MSPLPGISWVFLAVKAHELGLEGWAGFWQWWNKIHILCQDKILFCPSGPPLSLLVCIIIIINQASLEDKIPSHSCDGPWWPTTHFVCTDQDYVSCQSNCDLMSQGGLACCSPWDCKQSAMTGWLKVKSLSHVQLFATPWTVVFQPPPSMGFSRQEYWSGLPCPSPGDLPDPGIEPGSPTLQTDSLPSEPPGNPCLGNWTTTNVSKTYVIVLWPLMGRTVLSAVWKTVFQITILRLASIKFFILSWIDCWLIFLLTAGNDWEEVVLPWEEENVRK